MLIELSVGLIIISGLVSRVFESFSFYSYVKRIFRTKGKCVCAWQPFKSVLKKTNGGKTSGNKYSKKRKPEQLLKSNTQKKNEKRENRAKSSANALSKNWLFPLFQRKEKNANKFAADKDWAESVEMRVWYGDGRAGGREGQSCFCQTCFVSNTTKMLCSL